MSYLTTPELKSFSKAVISFWFRVPQAALDAAQKEYDDFYAADDPGDPPPLLGLVPLVVFGKEGTSPVTAESSANSTTNTTSTTVTQTVMNFTDSLDLGAVSYTYTINWFPDPDKGGTYTDTREYYETTFSYSPKPGKPTNPSFIAVDGNGELIINFESTQIGDVVLADVVTSDTGAYYTQESANYCWTYQFLDGCDAGSDTVTAPFGLCGLLIVIFAMVGYRLLTAVTDKLVDQGSSPREDHKATQDFGPGIGDAGTGTISFVPPVGLAADTWHHVLISVDMSGGSASTGIAANEQFGQMTDHITATSLLYVAVDDVNYKTGGWMFPDTNKVVTESALQIAGAYQAGSWDEDSQSYIPEGLVPSYSLSDMSVPAAKVGIPSVEKYVDKIRKVEMAEFMMFADYEGDTFDTSVEENRRLFIVPTKSGAKIPANPSPIYIPIEKYAVGDPANWEPGSDIPAFIPPLSSLDPSMIGSGNALLGTPDIDFTKCQFNWQTGLNLGKLIGKVIRTGKVKAAFPDPELEAGASGGTPGV